MGYVSRVTTQRNTLIETPFAVSAVNYIGPVVTGAGDWEIFKQNIDFSDIAYLWFTGAASEGGGANWDLLLKIDTTTKSTDTIAAAPTTFSHRIDCTAITGSYDLIVICQSAGAINAGCYINCNLWGVIA